MDTYILFNIFEGIFWIGMGIQCVVLSKMMDKEYYNISIFSASAFSFFGISDFLEIKTGALFGIWWLMAWKIVSLLAFVVIFIWYIKLRIKLGHSKNPEAHMTIPTKEVHLFDLFQCPACKMRYKEKKWADQCFDWCRIHHSCNLEIIEHAVNLEA
jgi:hypothetical protein